MVFFGFMVNYMLRVNLTIAIVDMVIPSNQTDKHGQEVIISECVAATPTVSTNSSIDDEKFTVSKPVSENIYHIHQVVGQSQRSYMLHLSRATYCGRSYRMGRFGANVILRNSEQNLSSSNLGRSYIE